jgi:hypothetical protein
LVIELRTIRNLGTTNLNMPLSKTIHRSLSYAQSARDY